MRAGIIIIFSIYIQINRVYVVYMIKFACYMHDSASYIVNLYDKQSKLLN